jgi:hypothetical protein
MLIPSKRQKLAFNLSWTRSAPGCLSDLRCAASSAGAIDKVSEDADDHQDDEDDGGYK